MTKPRFYRYDVCRHVDLYFCGRYFCNYGRHLYGFVATMAATFTIATTVAITVVPTATTTAIFVKAFLFEGNGRSGVILQEPHLLDLSLLFLIITQLSLSLNIFLITLQQILIFV